MGLFLMNLKVKKRDGTVVPFEKEKLHAAVEKAYIEVCGSSYGERQKQQITDVVERVCDSLQKNINSPTVDIEVVQDTVEYELMSVNKTVAKAYITYRYKRGLARNEYQQLMADVKEKLMASDVKNQNANVDEHSFGGRIGEMSDLIMKRYALDYCMSDMAKNNHLNNEIYIHDLSHYAVGDHNCLSIPFDDLLANGFNTRQTDVRPAQSVSTAFQLVAVIFQLQSLQQFGGVSATHLDWTMIPYVRKSFLKHYIVAWLKDSDGFQSLDLLNMIFEDYNEEVEGHIITRNKFDDWVDSHKSDFFEKTNTTEKEYTLDNKKLNKKYYQSALYDTIVETKQAVEGMYHNLNIWA